MPCVHSAAIVDTPFFVLQTRFDEGQGKSKCPAGYDQRPDLNFSQRIVNRKNTSSALTYMSSIVHLDMDVRNNRSTQTNGTTTANRIVPHGRPRPYL